MRDETCYRAALRRGSRRRPARPPGCASAAQAAHRALPALGLPDRRSDEDWRFTNLAPLTRSPFELAEPERADAARTGCGSSTSAAPAPARAGLRERPLLARSSRRGAADGRAHPGSLPGLLASSTEPPAGAAPGPTRQVRGARLHGPEHGLPAGRRAGRCACPRATPSTQPIHLVFVSTAAGGPPTASHPRKPDRRRARTARPRSSRATAGPRARTYFTNAVTEIVAGRGRGRRSLQGAAGERRDAFHIATAAGAAGAEQQASPTTRIALGGGLVRNEIDGVLRRRGRRVHAQRPLPGRRRSSTSTTTRVIDHAKPHCTSHELYKGILDGKAHGVFNGKIFVRQDAQKTDAKQTNQTLLLSDDATDQHQAAARDLRRRREVHPRRDRRPARRRRALLPALARHRQEEAARACSPSPSPTTSSAASGSSRSGRALESAACGPAPARPTARPRRRMSMPSRTSHGRRRPRAAAAAVRPGKRPRRLPDPARRRSTASRWSTSTTRPPRRSRRP